MNSLKHGRRQRTGYFAEQCSERVQLSGREADKQSSAASLLDYNCHSGTLRLLGWLALDALACSASPPSCVGAPSLDKNRSVATR